VAQFEVRLNAAQINRLLTQRGGGVVEWLVAKGALAATFAKAHCPVDTGRLRSSITHELRSQGGVPVVVIGTNVEYARFVHDGTGLYGPRHARIVPVRAKALVFTWRNAPVPPNGRGNFAGKWVFASVRGSPPKPFLRQGLEDAFRSL
jgi:hypothetical protein